MASTELSFANQATNRVLNERRVRRREIRKGHILEHEGVADVIGDFQVRPDLLGGAEQMSPISEQRSADLTDVVGDPGRSKAVDGVDPEPRMEVKWVEPAPAGQRTVAHATTHLAADVHLALAFVALHPPR